MGGNECKECDTNLKNLDRENKLQRQANNDVNKIECKMVEYLLQLYFIK